MNRPIRANRFMLFLIIFQTFFISLLMKFIDFSIFSIPQRIIVGQLLSFVIPFVLYQLVTKQSFKKIIPLNPLGITNIGLIILMSISIQPFMMFVSAISSLAFDNNVSSTMLQVDTSQILTLLIAISICPAILEEITFRGIVLQNFRKLGVKKASIFSGLFFGIMHMDPQQFLYAFILGIMFAYLVHYTKSIFASILAHFTINFIQAILFYLSKLALEFAVENGEFDMSDFDELVANQPSPIINLLIISIVFLVPLVILFTSFIKHNLVRNSTINVSTKHFEDEYEELNIVFNNQKVFTISFWAVIVLFISEIALRFIN